MDLKIFKRSDADIARHSGLDIGAFKFKVGHREQSLRLDELEKNNAMQRSDMIHAENERYFTARQIGMRHGTMNYYNYGVETCIGNHDSDRPRLHSENKTNPNIEDPLMSKVVKDGRLCQIFENKLKGRVGEGGKFANSLLKKYSKRVVNQTSIAGAKGGRKPIFRYDAEQLNPKAFTSNFFGFEV